MKIKKNWPAARVNPGSLANRLSLIGKFCRQEFERQTSVPFCVQWMVAPEYTIPESLDFKSFTGILQCQLLRTGGSGSGASVLTYWRSKSHFETKSQEFITRAGLVSCECAMRQLADIRVQKRSLLPSSPFDALLKVAAIIGAGTACIGCGHSRLAILPWSSRRPGRDSCA